MRSWLNVVLATLVPQLAMAEEIFIESQSPVSSRYAVLEDDGKVAFLYLTEVGVPKPTRHVFVYSRIQPVDRVDWERVRESGETPLLRKDVASPSAVIETPRAAEFSFRWAQDGESVAVLRNGLPLAFATSKEPFGYSRAVSVNSPLANAWNKERYASLFGL